MNKEEVFVFLDDLRDSGVINMFGASSYIESAFGLKRFEAKELLLEWMKTFSERHANEA